jgi:hypothetical protein
MGLKDLIRKGSEGLSDVALEKMMEWLDEYKKAVAVLEKFGFKVGKFNLSMGVLPEVQTSITGSIEDIQIDALKKMMEEHQGEALLLSLVKALIVTRQIWEQVDLKLTGVTLKVTLSVPPKIDVEIY